MKHFIKETDFAAHELPGLFASARRLKQTVASRQLRFWQDRLGQ